MNIVPFGEVKDDRWILCKKYGLVESINGFWRMTKKARENYEPVSFIGYLQGKIEKPDRLGSREPVIVAVPRVSKDTGIKSNDRQKIIDEILSM